MSKRLNLREFQQRVIDRMQDKDLSAARISTLGVQIAGQNWLVEMTDISEVLPLPPLTPIPFAKPWFRGVANVRGNLYGVTDMASYQHGSAASGDINNRVLLVAGHYAFNAALLVDRVLGLRDARDWQQDDENEQAGYRDEQGARWRTLDVPGLLEQAEFLQIGG
jgi:twitching motility protein PilI